MKRKHNIFLFFLGICMLFVGLFTITGCKVECKHSEWTEYTIVKEATCTEEGTKSRECVKCEELETVKIPKMDHTFDQKVAQDAYINSHFNYRFQLIVLC